MTPSRRIRSVYDPDILKIMADAFDHACNSLPVQFINSDRMRRKLALHILREVNDGESDSTRLADSAVLSVFGCDAPWTPNFQTRDANRRQR
jgi:hypothetical protein